MDRRRLSAIAHADHPVAAPIGAAAVTRLLEQALPASGRVLDLGCGRGAWLHAAVGVRPGVVATGVDVDPLVLGLAAEVDPSIEWIEHDAATYAPPVPADVVLCIGSVHAFGSFEAALAGAGRHVAPDGTLVLGDGFWDAPPHEGTFAAGFEVDDHRPLAEVVDLVVSTGWEVVAAHVSSTEEWDAYEWAWTGTLTRWAIEHPDDPDADGARAAAREHRHHWLRGWRGVLGFVTLVLRRPAG